jgi:hypothetical protein
VLRIAAARKSIAGSGAFVGEWNILRIFAENKQYERRIAT